MNEWRWGWWRRRSQVQFARLGNNVTQLTVNSQIGKGEFKWNKRCVRFDKMHKTLLFFLFPLLAVLTSGDNGTHIFHSRSRRSPAVALHPERLKLIKEALGWMTFRKSGELMTDAQLEPLFLNTLNDKYRTSKFYRTFVIAFQQAVLPRLTLQENDPCNPASTLDYKDPDNSSVTWHYQKKFTFDNYKTQRSSSAKFCDYRQGLVCKQATKKCQCPEGSKMQSIDKGSPVKRCLLEENEICALIDIDHGNDPSHTALARNLYHLIFNLEKPPSCKMGTQCRFKLPNRVTTLCYDITSGPFYPPPPGRFVTTSWPISLGAECVLGLIAKPGSCDIPRDVGVLRGYVCYNFGPPRSQRSLVKENRTGVCAHEYGPYGIAKMSSELNGRMQYDPLFSVYVHPGSVRLRGGDLKAFYQRFDPIFDAFLGTETPEKSEGGRCSVSSTKTLEEAWKYFASLEEEPPVGQDYVAGATKAKLDAGLQFVMDVIKDPSKKVCQMYKTGWGYRGPMTCVAEDPPDSAGNDGKCRRSPNQVTEAFDKKFEKYLNKIGDAQKEQANEEYDYQREILTDHPEAVCSPSLVSSPQARGHNHAEVQEGGYCPEGFICAQDYSDDRGMYDYFCSFDSEDQTLEFVCHETRDGIRYGRCEAQKLDEKLSEEFEKMVGYSRLGSGKTCRYQLEEDIRNMIRGEESNRNKYALLALLEKERKSGGVGGGFCNRAGLVECTKGGVCECVKGTEPRKVTVHGVEYKSDFCYLARGYCARKDLTELSLTKSEKAAHASHYDVNEEDRYHCGKNVCVFVDRYGESCTTENTGKTGYDLKPDPTQRPPPVYPDSQGGSAGGPGWRHVGGAADLRGSRMVTGLSLAISALFLAMIR